MLADLEPRSPEEAGSIIDSQFLIIDSRFSILNPVDYNYFQLCVVIFLLDDVY